MSEDNHLQKLIRFHKERKRMPSYSEIMTLAGFKSKNAAFRLVKKLTDRQYLEKDKHGKLLPGRLFSSLRMLGTIEAGWPSPAEEELLDTMTLDEFLISNKEATYMLTVNGDSMADAGIIRGDIALVERTNQAKDGDIVIAEVDGGWTMKYLRKRGKEIYLEPANKKYRKIIPKESLKIAAVVKAIIRKY
jgi:SOS regulatory protein LexA